MNIYNQRVSLRVFDGEISNVHPDANIITLDFDNSHIEYKDNCVLIHYQSTDADVVEIFMYDKISKIIIYDS